MSYKFNPFTGNFDLVNDDAPENFSYDYVAPGQTITIPEGQQMLVSGEVRVLGHLSVQGELIDVSARQAESFFYDTIGVNEVVEVLPNRLLLFKQHLTVLGHLRVNGRLGEV